MKKLICLSFLLFPVCFHTSIFAQAKEVKPLKTNIKNYIANEDREDYSFIFEAGNINTNVFETDNFINRRATGLTLRESLTDRENSSFMNSSLDWQSMTGFLASIKVAKTINNSVYGSQVSLDFIAGIEYKEINIWQNFYDPWANQIGFGWLNCYGPTYNRDVNIKSISIPLDIRTNIQLKNWTLSPIFGVGVDLPVSKSETLYQFDYQSDEIKRGELVAENKLKIDQKLNYHTTSKFEIAYALPNDHNIKLTGFYLINITNQLADQLWDNQGLSSKGFYLGYEVPFSSFR